MNGEFDETTVGRKLQLGDLDCIRIRRDICLGTLARRKTPEEGGFPNITVTEQNEFEFMFFLRECLEKDNE